MGKIFLCGDTHGTMHLDKLNIENFPIQSTLNKEDYVIVLGDFGLIWYPKTHELYPQHFSALKELCQANYTLMFVDGNHENFDIINDLPTIKMFGGTVGVYAVEEIINGDEVIHYGNIYHLKRGEIYQFNNTKILTLGGAESQDKLQRIEHIDWWREEELNMKEQNYALTNLDNNNWEVDYVLSHTCPSSVANMLMCQKSYVTQCSSKDYDRFLHKKKETQTTLFQFIYEQLEFKDWHFGHWHYDGRVDEQFFCHFNEPPILLCNY